MNAESPQQKIYRVNTKYIIYLLVGIVVVLLCTTLSFGYILYNVQRDYSNSLQSSISKSIEADKSNISSTSSSSESTSVSSSSTSNDPEVNFSSNTGKYLSFDYQEGDYISIESFQKDDKFNSIEDVKSIHIKGDFYEISMGKNKLASPNQSTISEKIEYINDSKNCNYIIKGITSDKVNETIPCNNSSWTYKSIANPGFAYDPTKNLILFVNSNNSDIPTGKFTSFGSPSGTRQIIAIENTLNSSSNVSLRNLPDTWKNSLYIEFRCNKVNDVETAKKCMIIFASFLSSFEFKK